MVQNLPKDVPKCGCHAACIVGKGVADGIPFNLLQIILKSYLIMLIYSARLYYLWFFVLSLWLLTFFTNSIHQLMINPPQLQDI